MRFAKRVIIAASLTDDMPELLEKIRSMEFLKQSEVHLVCVFKTINYSYGLNESLILPAGDDRKAVEQSVMATLEKLAPGILPKDFEGKLITRCLFDDSPKDKFCSYLEEVKADAVIVSTRKKRGFFESSFAQFVSKHTTADVIILKGSNT